LVTVNLAGIAICEKQNPTHTLIKNTDKNIVFIGYHI